MRKKTILVTGGSGFIGTNLINFLSKKKYNIINLDKNSYASTPEKFKIIKNKKHYKFVKIDLRNKKKIFLFIKKFKPNIIVNLAAESHVDRSIDESETFINNNIIGTFNLLNAINNIYKQRDLKNTKFIHISTDEVYGNNIGKPSKEDSPYKPRSPYSASKASADHLAKSFLYTYNLPIIILNFCNNYGPYQFTEKFVPTVIYNVLKNKKIPVYGKGKNIREWIYVEDCCKAIEIIIGKGKAGDHFNIGSGFRCNNLYLAKMICSIIQKVKLKKLNKKNLISFVKDRPGHDFKYALNSSSFKKKIKYISKTNIKNGLKKTIYWYLNNKDWYKHSKKFYKGQRLGLK